MNPFEHCIELARIARAKMKTPLAQYTKKETELADRAIAAMNDKKAA